MTRLSLHDLAHSLALSTTPREPKPLTPQEQHAQMMAVIHGAVTRPSTPLVQTQEVKPHEYRPE
jgi:hypothetical protein